MQVTGQGMAWRVQGVGWAGSTAIPDSFCSGGLVSTALPLIVGPGT